MSNFTIKTINFFHNRWVQWAGGTALAVLIWSFSSKALQDILVFGAALYAGRHVARGAAVWRQPAGIGCMAVAAYMVLTLPFSAAPAESWRDFSGLLEVFAGAFAIPIIFHTRRRLEWALLCSANAMALTLAYDLLRLYRILGPAIMEQAHAFQPFILNHSNVASMMAGLAALTYFYFLTRQRHKFWPMAGCLAGICLCLAYQIILASRGPQAALALTVAVAGAILPGWRAKIFWGLGCAVIAIIVMAHAERINPRFTKAAAYAAAVAPDAGAGRFREFFRSNLSQRDIVWARTWQLARQHPWCGHGYGKRNFTRIYYQSEPPAADFFFPHPHHYWLKLMFEFGLTGVLVFLCAWLLLAWQMARRIYAEKGLAGRIWPGTVALMLLYIHLYGLGDYPDHIVQIAQIWLIPVALAIIAERRPARTIHGSPAGCAAQSPEHPRHHP